MDYFPLFMDLRGRRCLVAGGGDVAARKASLLLRAGARVHVVAPSCDASLRALCADPALHYEAREFRPADLQGVALVIAATDAREVNAEISRAAQALNVPVNAVDDPLACSAIMPAFVERGALLVAIGTSGAAPVLARLVRARIEALLPAQYGELAALCAELRSEVQQLLPDVDYRRRFWESVLEGEVAELALRGERDAAQRGMRERLDEFARTAAVSGEGAAYLIGVGPNDPELVSFRALRYLQRADLVFVLQGVADAIAELRRRDAARVTVSGELHQIPDAVLQRMAAEVSQGRRACMLARGDAFRTRAAADVLARLTALGVPHRVVPGVSE